MNTIRKRAACLAAALLLVSALLSGCAANENQPAALPELNSVPITDDGALSSEAARLLETMSDEQKLAQLFVIRPDSLDPSLSSETINDSSSDGVTELSAEMLERLEKYPVGGVCIFGKNLESAEQLEKLLADVKNGCGIAPFLCVDEEGGSVARIANSGLYELPTYESMSAVGASGDPEQARQVGLSIGGYLADIGFNLDFAPDADVNTNPDNPVIGKRAFSGDPQTVADMVSAQIGGMHESGVMCCIKHYPGHGDTSSDTHVGSALTDKTWSQLKNCELIPFAAGIQAGADMVMVAHILAPNADDSGLPASMSQTLLSRLRGELGFEGVIVTDSLAMGAITKDYSPSEAALAALNAGVDILLMPEDFTEAYDGLKSALENGTLSRSRVDESVLRILTLKENRGLI